MRRLKKSVWPFQITVNGTLEKEANRWCNCSLGTQFVDWYGYNIMKNVRVYSFKESEAMMLFKLYWGCNEIK